MNVMSEVRNTGERIRGQETTPPEKTSGIRRMNNQLNELEGLLDESDE